MLNSQSEQLMNISDFIKEMCFSSRKKKVWIPPTNRMTSFPVKFDEQQICQLQRKYKKMCGSEKEINRIHFEKNMGIMGLQTVYGFSNRLFNSFDIDQDGKINFEDFVQYMEILKCGSEENKALISFRLIDIKNKQRISIQDFRSFLSDYFHSWSSITNSSVSEGFKEQTEKYVVKLFENIEKETGKKQIGFEYYIKSMYGKKDFMDAFSFISDGVAEMFIQDKAGKNSANFSYYETLKRVNQIYETHFIKAFQLNREGQHFQDEQSYRKQQSHSFHSIFNSCERGESKNSSKTDRILQMKEKEIIELKRRMLAIENDLKMLVKDNSEELEKLQKKYEKMDNNEELDITSIIMNIPKQTPKKSKAEGKMILFGDEKWNLVLNMMIGIQMAVGSVNGFQELFFEQPQDFHLKYSFELVPRRFGQEKKTKRICQFTDYAPNTFNHIRRIFKIDNNEYINSIGPNKLMKSLMMGQLSSLTELTSQGKSGSFFYYTTDGKYMLKTIQHREYLLLRKILKDYYFYLRENPDSLLIKFYGLHRLHFQSDLAQEDESGKIYFVIMGNVFNTKQKIIERYDIKGSTYGRTNRSQNPDATKKDLDFVNKYPKGIFFDNTNQRDKVVEILRKDANFLRDHQILDYSILVGIYRREKNLIEDILHIDTIGRQKGGQEKRNNCYGIKESSSVFILGVIDILIEYDVRKAMEYYFKKMLHGDGVSAVPPADYSQRFNQFIENQVFPSATP